MGEREKELSLSIGVQIENGNEVERYYGISQVCSMRRQMRHDILEVTDIRYNDKDIDVMNYLNLTVKTWITFDE